MRDLKFRAWVGASDNKSMSEPFDLIGAERVLNPFWDEPVMQYTGLKDKNGKEIYEGDVVQLSNRACYVEYSNGAFHLRNDDPMSVSSMEYNGLLKGYCEGFWGGPPEVIENIWEKQEPTKTA